MITGGINHQKPQGSDWVTGDGKNETARGNPGRSALAQLPARPGRRRQGTGNVVFVNLASSVA